MRSRAWYVITLFAGLSGALLAALAQPVNASMPTPAGPHEAIYLAMMAGMDQEQQLSTLTTTMAQQFAAAPELVEAEAKYPGLSRAMAAAMRPVLRAYTNRIRETFEPRFIAVLRGALTPVEARDIADFYASPLGRKLLGGISDSYDGKATVADALKGGDISAEALAADNRTTVRRALARFTPAEMAEMGALARRKPALLKMSAIGESFKPLRLEMENTPLQPAEEQALESAITAAIEKHIRTAAR